jgi:hypothetical protein
MSISNDRLQILYEYHELASSDIDPEIFAWLKFAIFSLPRKLRRIIKIYYGLDRLPPCKDFDTISTLTGINKRQAIHGYTTAMTKLKKLSKSTNSNFSTNK